LISTCHNIVAYRIYEPDYDEDEKSDKQANKNKSKPAKLQQKTYF